MATIGTSSADLTVSDQTGFGRSVVSSGSSFVVPLMGPADSGMAIPLQGPDRSGVPSAVPTTDLVSARTATSDPAKTARPARPRV